MQNNSWARLLAYVTGLVNQRLLLQCEYLIAENRILRSHVSANVRLSDSERRALAEIGKRLGRTLLSEVACVAKPETILGWYRRLIARKFDGSKHRSYPGRPRVRPEVEALVVRMAQENGSWGYDRLAGALAQSRPPSLRSDDREHSEAARHRASAEAQPEYDLKGLRRRSHGHPCRYRLLHG